MVSIGKLELVRMLLILIPLAIIAFLRLRQGKDKPAHTAPTSNLSLARELVGTIALSDRQSHAAKARIMSVYEGVGVGAVDDVTIRRAMTKLAALPLTTLPAAASLPLASRLWQNDTLCFVGREAELALLAEWLKGDTPEVGGQLAVVTGPQGIGKTYLAVAFAEHYGQFFQGGVFFLDFANPEAIRFAIAACGRQMNELPTDLAEQDLLTQVQLVLNAWQSPTPRLLIFDDCDSPALLAQWMPPLGGCRVLVTSRRHWPVKLEIPTLMLEPLQRAASTELLRMFSITSVRPRGRTEEPTFAAIAANLGDVPLALYLAGCYLAQRYPIGTPTMYFTQLRKQHPDESWVLPTSHIEGYLPPPLMRALTITYQQLATTKAEDALVLMVLVCLTCFAPNAPIPYQLAIAILSQEKIKQQTTASAEAILQRLIQLGLVVRGHDNLLLHSQIAHFVRRIAGDKRDEAQMAVERTLLSEARQCNNANRSCVLIAWQVHLRHVTEHAWERFDLLAAGLCNSLGVHLTALGELTDALPYLERGLVIYEGLHGEQHPDTARSLNNLGALLGLLGEYTKAHAYLERALRIRETILGQHLDTARSLRNLGLLWDLLGDIKLAQFYFARALSIFDAQLGAMHAETENLRAQLATYTGY